MNLTQFAQTQWKTILKPGTTVIDATVGNGHDTAFLASLQNVHVIGYDIQQEALARARTQLPAHVTLKLQSHATFDETQADLIVYNLGYLPGSDHAITTQTETTLQSLASALDIVQHTISIMCYPGHEEGARETEAVAAWAASLSPQNWGVTHITLPNRHRAPSLFLIHSMMKNVPHTTSPTL